MQLFIRLSSGIIHRTFDGFRLDRRWKLIVNCGWHTYFEMHAQAREIALKEVKGAPNWANLGNCVRAQQGRRLLLLDQVGGGDGNITAVAA